MTIFVLQHFFEEPEGRIELPQSLKEKVHSWRRLQDLLSDGKVMPNLFASDTVPAMLEKVFPGIDLLSILQRSLDQAIF